MNKMKDAFNFDFVCANATISAQESGKTRYVYGEERGSFIFAGDCAADWLFKAYPDGRKQYSMLGAKLLEANKCRMEAGRYLLRLIAALIYNRQFIDNPDRLKVVVSSRQMELLRFANSNLVRFVNSESIADSCCGAMLVIDDSSPFTPFVTSALPKPEPEPGIDILRRITEARPRIFEKNTMNLKDVTNVALRQIRVPIKEEDHE